MIQLINEIVMGSYCFLTQTEVNLEADSHQVVLLFIQRIDQLLFLLPECSYLSQCFFSIYGMVEDGGGHR